MEPVQNILRAELICGKHYGENSAIWWKKEGGLLKKKYPLAEFSSSLPGKTCRLAESNCGLAEKKSALLKLSRARMGK